MLALTSVSNSFTSTKAQSNPQCKVVNEPAGNIRFISSDGDMLVFELSLRYLLPKGSMIRIMDEANNIIFEERTDIETYNIRYKIIRNDMKKNNFEISSRNLFLNQSFNVNFRKEEKIEVTKA